METVIEQTNPLKPIIITDDSKFLIVPNIVYGSDDIGNNFIYMKLKNFVSGGYIEEFYSIMYQKKTDESEMRKDFIIGWIQKNFETGEVRIFKNKKHFFIKGKLFKTMDKINKFYNNMITNIICEIGTKNISPDVFEEQDYTKRICVLNYK